MKRTNTSCAGSMACPDRRWRVGRKNPAAIEDSLAAHTKAIQLIRGNQAKAIVLRECSVHATFFSAVLADMPVAAEAWTTEARRRFGLLQQNALVPSALPPGHNSLGKWMQVPSWSFCPCCGLRSTEAPLAPGWRKNVRLQVEKACKGGCDPSPEQLDSVSPEDQDVARTRRLMAYMVPQACHWNDLVEELLGFASFHAAALLPQIDWSALAILDFKVDYTTRRGGRASITSKQKQSLVRGVWKHTDVETAFPGEGERRAFAWLMTNNETYKKWVLHHKALLDAATPGDNSWRYIRTAELLLHSPGLEVAARPWLYPRQFLRRHRHQGPPEWPRPAPARLDAKLAHKCPPQAPQPRR